MDVSVLIIILHVKFSICPYCQRDVGPSESLAVMVNTDMDPLIIQTPGHGHFVQKLHLKGVL